ncbi:MAG: hydroxymethylglutaryl-CoA lyase [Bacteroidia bacterium]
MTSLKLTECPRDAMQGIKEWIPSELKTRYLQALLAVGFDRLDFGSFVSPKAIPQLKDTAEVLAGLDTSKSNTDLLAIVVNLRGAQDAARFKEVKYLGYPFSISETFEQRNTHKSIAQSVEIVKQIQELCVREGKELLLYLSMAFGNPYGDPWNVEIVEEWAEQMSTLGIKRLSLADTAGSADPASIKYLYSNLIPRFPDLEWGAHFHSHAEKRHEKLQAAWDHGCRRFDSAMMGFGGCPFAHDELVGNIATESVLSFCESLSIDLELNMEAFSEAQAIAREVFLKTAQ